MPQGLRILDVTIRDGSYAIDYQYTPDQVAAIVAELDAAGIPLIEVSHGCGLGARENAGIGAAASDAEYVAAAKGAAKNAKIGVIAGAAPITTPAEIDAVIDNCDFIRFAANVDAIGTLKDNIAYTTSRGVEVFVQMMRSSRRSLKDVIAAARQAESLGASMAYLVDTTSYFTPDDVRTAVTALKDAVSIGIGFHAHNNLGLAVANTLAAVDAGCDCVDASLRGMGRSAGNAQLEALVSLLKRRGMATEVDLDRLLDAGEKLIAPIMPPAKGINAIDVACADINLDVYPLSFFQLLANNAGLTLRTFVRQLAKSGNFVEVDIPHVRKALTDLGADPDGIFNKLGIPNT